MTKKLPGVLVDTAHERVWVDREAVIADANIPLSFLYTSTEGILGEDELKYARKYPSLIQKGIWGLTYVGEFKPPILTRMASMTGLFLRNFIRARIVPMHRLLDDIENGEAHDVSVVLIPDFFTIASKTPAWRTAKVYSWLLNRWSREKQTVIAVSDIDAMTAEWGHPVRKHLESYFGTVEA